jgi:hypothetical protein
VDLKVTKILALGPVVLIIAVSLVLEVLREVEELLFDVTGSVGAKW